MDRRDRSAQLGQTDKEEERDRNERKLSSQTDGKSVKQTQGQTGVGAKRTGGGKTVIFKQAGRQADCHGVRRTNRETSR